MIRLLQIIWTLLYYRIFWKPKTEKQNKAYGERLSLALQKLGPSFIKLGQALSTRPDILGQAIAGALVNLQDSLPPFTSKLAIDAIEKSFKKPIDQLFKKFNPTPHAAASIAQVHQATLFDGSKVAVKILRPKIHKAFHRDIKLFFKLAKIISFFRPSTHRLNLVEVVKIYQKTIESELDMRLEASAASELGDAFKKNPNYNVPKIYWTYVSASILTTQWIDGTVLNKIKTKKDFPKAALKQILTSAADGFFYQVFELGFFHADPHPGNFIIDKKNKLWVIDFGIMGRISYQERLYIADILVGFLTRNYAQVAEAHFNAGYLTDAQQIGKFTQAVRAIAEPIHDKPLKEMSLGTLLKQLFTVSKAFNMTTQPQLILLQKSLLTSEGMCAALYPEINLWRIAEPLVKDWIRTHQGPEAKAARFIKGLYHFITNFTSEQTNKKDRKYA